MDDTSIGRIDAPVLRRLGPHDPSRILQSSCCGIVVVIPSVANRPKKRRLPTGTVRGLVLFPDPSFLTFLVRDDQMDVDEIEDIHPDHLRIPHDPPNVSEERVFPNPFQHPRHGHLYRSGSALIITGLPGIGLLCPSVSSPCFER
jgi:hypothetical protein